jgi:hypothetical protein
MSFDNNTSATSNTTVFGEVMEIERVSAWTDGSLDDLDDLTRANTVRNRMPLSPVSESEYEYVPTSPSYDPCDVDKLDVEFASSPIDAFFKLPDDMMSATDADALQAQSLPFPKSFQSGSCSYNPTAAALHISEDAPVTPNSKRSLDSLICPGAPAREPSTKATRSSETPPVLRTE